MKKSSASANQFLSLVRLAVPASATFAGTHAAAAVVYTDATATIPFNAGTISLDLGDGFGGQGAISTSEALPGHDFSLNYSASDPAKPQIVASASDGAISSFGSPVTNNARQFASDATIDASLFNSSTTSTVIYDPNSSTGISEWQPGETGYLAVKFVTGGSDTHYGWIDLTLGNDQSLTVNGFAYESTGGQAIVAGAVPEPATAGLVTALLAGSAALYRRRQKTA